MLGGPARQLRITALIVFASALLGPAADAAPLPDPERQGTQNLPGVNYVSIKKRDHASGVKRFTLRIFTTYTDRKSDSITVPFDGDVIPARYAGPNRKFDEWRIGPTSPSAARLLRTIAKHVKKGPGVRFNVNLTRNAFPDPSVAECALTGFNDLGTCQGQIVAQRSR